MEQLEPRKCNHRWLRGALFPYPDRLRLPQSMYLGWLLLWGHLRRDENAFDSFFTPKMRKMEHGSRSRWSRRSRWNPPSYALALLCHPGLAIAKAIASWDHHHHGLAGALDIQALIVARSRLLSQPP